MGTAIQFESIDRAEARELATPDVLHETIDRAESRVRIIAAFRRVPALYRQVLVDHFLRGCSVRQIARRNCVPLGTALSRLFKARRLLRAAWEG